MGKAAKSITRLYWLLLVVRSALRNAWAVASGSRLPLLVDSPLLGLDRLPIKLFLRNWTSGKSDSSLMPLICGLKDTAPGVEARAGSMLPGGALCCRTSGYRPLGLLACVKSTWPGSGDWGSKGDTSTSPLTGRAGDAGSLNTSTTSGVGSSILALLGTGVMSGCSPVPWYMFVACSLLKNQKKRKSKCNTHLASYFHTWESTSRTNAAGCSCRCSEWRWASNSVRQCARFSPASPWQQPKY